MFGQSETLVQDTNYIQLNNQVIVHRVSIYVTWARIVRQVISPVDQKDLNEQKWTKEYSRRIWAMRPKFVCLTISNR